jgi:hypothetical protein
VRFGERTTRFHLAMRDRWRDYLGAQAVPAIDPVERLRRERGTVFIDYLHYTPHGNDVMAQEVFRSLRPLILARAARAAAG